MSPCIGCNRPTHGEPSICDTCAAERVTHGTSKAIERARGLRDRMTKESPR